MPDLDEIRDTWNHESGWLAAGDEWSGPWGGTESLWWGTLLPRIHAFLPAGVVIELGAGYGRWSHYLKDLAGQLILVDVAQHCVDACRQRFDQDPNVSCHLGDGTSLPMVGDESVDFAFSFDSLVHAEADVLRSYVRELARTLRPDGIAFIHHSNMAVYRRAASLARRVPDQWRRPLTIHGLLVNVYAWRAESTSARQFAQFCAQTGLSCVGQELIAWEYGRHLSDAISVVARRGSRWDRPTEIVRNRAFMSEARQRARLVPLYGAEAWSAGPGCVS